MSHKDDFIPDGKPKNHGGLRAFFPENMPYVWAIDIMSETNAILTVTASQPRELFTKTARMFGLGKFSEPPDGSYVFDKHKLLRAKLGLISFKAQVVKEIQKNVLDDGIVLLQTTITDVKFILNNDTFLIEVILNALYARK